MRRKLIILFVLALYSCNNKTSQDISGLNTDTILIEGQLEGGDKTLVTLDLMGSTAFIPMDSVRCDADGSFKILFQAEGMNYYSLKYTEHGYVTIIAQPGDKIKLIGSAEKLYPYQILGSEPSKMVSELASAHNSILEELRAISKESERIIGSAEYSKKKLALNERFDSITAAFHHYSRDFILKNPGSPAILIALYNQYGPGLPVFNPLTDLGIYQFADSVLYKKYPENEAVRSLHSQLFAAMQQLRNQEIEVYLKKGDPAPDFVSETLEGAKFALKDASGKYVLLHFWASWSKPSIDENRFISDCCQKYAEKDLIIVQVSIDSEKAEWAKAAGNSKKNWVHISDLKRWDSPLVNLYRVERIPANFLINPNGRIVEMDIFGEELSSTLQQYLD